MLHYIINFNLKCRVLSIFCITNLSYIHSYCSVDSASNQIISFTYEQQDQLTFHGLLTTFVFFMDENEKIYCF